MKHIGQFKLQLVTLQSDTHENKLYNCITNGHTYVSGHIIILPSDTHLNELVIYYITI